MNRARLTVVPRRPVLAAVALAAAVLSAAAGAAATPKWTGVASCTFNVTADGYKHSETQRWQLAGPTSARGSFLFVASHWTDTGSGASHVEQGDQTRDIRWTVKAAATGKFQFVVRASDHKLLIGQANAQLRAQDGILGVQQQTIGGIPQTPGPIDLEAFETQLPHIVVAATSKHVSGSMPPTVVHGSVGPFQPGAAQVTKSCTWRFNRSG